MAIGRKNMMMTGLLLVVLAILALAWADGGREEERMIEQVITLPAVSEGAGA